MHDSGIRIHKHLGGLVWFTPASDLDQQTNRKYNENQYRMRFNSSVEITVYR